MRLQDEKTSLSKIKSVQDDVLFVSHIYKKYTAIYARLWFYFVIHITFLSNEGPSLETLDRLFFPSNRYGYFEMTRRGIAPFWLRFLYITAVNSKLFYIFSFQHCLHGASNFMASCWAGVKLCCWPNVRTSRDATLVSMQSICFKYKI